MYSQGLRGKYMEKVLWNTEDEEIDWNSINTAKSGKAIPFSSTQYVKIKPFQLRTPALI